MNSLGKSLGKSLLALTWLSLAHVAWPAGVGLSAASADGLSNNGAAKWLAEQDVEFLKVDQAFALTTEIGQDGALLARWEMPDGYYLYRHAFQFETRGAAGAALGEAEIPPGKAKLDEFFGDVEVYYHSAQARLPLTGVVAASTDAPAEVGITYQGCADAGLCYPPETKWVALDVSSGSAFTGGSPTSAASAELAANAGLPGPILSADVGDVGISGYCEYNGKAFALEGEGHDIGGTSDGVSAAGCTGRGAPLRAGLLSLLCAVTLGGCGNKGELFLPASPEDERTLERIDTSLDERTPPEAVLPGLPSPTRAPSGTARVHARVRSSNAKSPTAM